MAHATPSLSLSAKQAGTAGETEIAHASFIDVDFLRRYGLTKKNILEYFYASPFYLHCGGPSSLNERRRRGQEALRTGNSHEFKLIYANEDAEEGRAETSVFVIQKEVFKEGKEGSVPSDVFYVLAGSIYKAPQLSELFEAAVCQAARSVDVVLKRQMEGVDRKRQRLDEDGQKRASASKEDSQELSRWPDWCIFEQKTVQNAWMSEALKATQSAKHTSRSSATGGPSSDEAATQTAR
eukprot:TRINITY_DN14398_c0_g1_i1.p1 TRINITY_DN14398_c0_g1~~TRINITY_DN14398_c0_g1_i1.p1  ORF type:complete len:249 (-),score=48.99 TRINITY_DN14398_c0_g1_i1:372-1085(-)